MTIRDFRDNAGAACSAQVRNVPVFAFTQTGQQCADGPICQAN
jgi:hypothetical protein